MREPAAAHWPAIRSRFASGNARLGGWLALEQVGQLSDAEVGEPTFRRASSVRAEPQRKLAKAEKDGRNPDPLPVIIGQRSDLGVPGQERVEQFRRAGLAVMQQEVAEVEVELGAAHLTEVDDAVTDADVARNAT
jgi:hypothetical protein